MTLSYFAITYHQETLLLAVSFDFFVAVVPKNSPIVGTEKKKGRKKSYRERVPDRDQREMASETQESTDAALRQKKIGIRERSPC